MGDAFNNGGDARQKSVAILDVENEVSIGPPHTLQECRFIGCVAK
jgi:hypothetical protein